MITIVIKAKPLQLSCTTVFWMMYQVAKLPFYGFTLVNLNYINPAPHLLTPEFSLSLQLNLLKTR